MADMLTVSWNNHAPTFFHMLSSLRRMEKFTDVTLSCDGKFYGVHKLVLASCSDYFMEVFEKTSCKHPVIILKDIKEKEMEALLNYMYEGVVSVAQEDLSKFIATAEFLQIKGLAAPDEPLVATEEDNTRICSQSNRELDTRPPENVQSVAEKPTEGERPANIDNTDTNPIVISDDEEEAPEPEEKRSQDSHMKVPLDGSTEEEEEVEVDVVHFDTSEKSKGALTKDGNSSDEDVDAYSFSDQDGLELKEFERISLEQAPFELKQLNSLSSEQGILELTKSDCLSSDQGTLINPDSVSSDQDIHKKSDSVSSDQVILKKSDSVSSEQDILKTSDSVSSEQSVFELKQSDSLSLEQDTLKKSDSLSSDQGIPIKSNSVSSEQDVLELKKSDRVDSLNEKQLKVEMVTSKASLDTSSPKMDTDAGESQELDLTKCCLCQGDDRNLHYSTRGYRHLATYLPAFLEIGEKILLPLKVLEEDNLFQYLSENNAKYHRYCFAEYSVIKLMRLKRETEYWDEMENHPSENIKNKKRKADESSKEHVYIPGRKRRYAARSKLICCICNQRDCSNNLRFAGYGKKTEQLSLIARKKGWSEVSSECELYYHRTCFETLHSVAPQTE